MFKVTPGQLVSFRKETILLSTVPKSLSGTSFSHHPHLLDTDYAIIIEDIEMWIHSFSNRRLQVLTKFGVGFVDENALVI